MPKTETDIDLSTEQIDAKLDQLRAEAKPLERRAQEIRDEIRRLQEQRRELTIPFRQGDIVEDEMGVRYRVTGFGTYGKGDCMGIRLAKAGHEAHTKPRPIYSNKLRKVNPGD